MPSDAQHEAAVAAAAAAAEAEAVLAQQLDQEYEALLPEDVKARVQHAIDRELVSN